MHTEIGPNYRSCARSTEDSQMPPEKKNRVLQLIEAGTLGVASLTFVALLIVSGLAASPNADSYGFKNSTGDISDEYFTQVCKKRSYYWCAWHMWYF